MKFDKFIKLLKCGKIGKFDNEPDVTYVFKNEDLIQRSHCKLEDGSLHFFECDTKLYLYKIESNLWQVEDETLTFQQILELSKKIGEVIVKRLSWKDLDRKKVFIIDGGVVQEKRHPDGYVDVVLSMNKEDEIATDWVIVED